MDNLRNSILLYFDQCDPETILNQDLYHSSNPKKEENHFMQLAPGIRAFDHRTDNELRNIHQKLATDWMYPPGYAQCEQYTKSIFYLLTHFTEQVLKEVEAEPFIHYQHLLKWRNLSLRLGEDLFTTSFLAYRDLMARKKRNFFAWRPVLFSDNRRLHELLQKGVAENHSHLWASGLTFELSWLALTNRYNHCKKAVHEMTLKRRLTAKGSHGFNSTKAAFDIQIQKGVALRLLLFLSLEHYESNNNNHPDLESFLAKIMLFDFDPQCIFCPSNSSDSFEFTMIFPEILDHINRIGQQSGLKLPHNGTHKIVDYAANRNMSAQNFNGCYYLVGERQLLYNCFRIIYSSLGEKKDITLFQKMLYSYLLIKNQFHDELIQVNGRMGFANFENYQDRKMEFIAEDSVYHTLFLDVVLNYNPTLMHIVSNEQRLNPKKSGKEIRKTLENILLVRSYHKSDYYDWEKRLLGKSDPLDLVRKGNIRQEEFELEELYFVLHFLKTPDTLQAAALDEKDSINKIIQSIKPRDYALRRKIKEFALAIREFRELYPKLAKFVRGIDAASNELSARPEAFAQAFRLLKNHQLRSENNDVKGELVSNKLNITYHAGEDFYDIIDGLRYIDESIRFLDMGIGDRFGHALAMGIDPSHYYELKQRKLMIPKHVLLDNIAWLLSKVRKFGLGEHVNEGYRLENIFKSLFSEIYLQNTSGNMFQHIHYQQFYDSWKLRGDDPGIYFEYYTNCKTTSSNIGDYFLNLKNITFWERCRINRTNPKLDSLRRREEITRLYFEYHYNPKVKSYSSELKQFEVTPEYILLVSEVQKHMMRYVAIRNISIETNPTSNYLIGTIGKYVNHPIKKWYNLGLETDLKKIQDSPQLSVSINTDDAGIFATSLENEFALMAIALEKEKDENGNQIYKSAMIYDWLDRIREMGIYQSFLDKKSNMLR